MTQFLARSLSHGDRAENSRGSAVPSPPAAPADPIGDFLKKCREEFLRRHFEEVGPDEFCNRRAS